jgi:FkbM family methyltransferase
MISKVKKILSSIQNNLLRFIYLLKPKYLHYQSYNLFRDYAARPKIVGLELAKDTLIGKRKDIIYLPNDSQLTWQVMKYGELDYPISKVIKTKLKNDEKYVFIDIGANVGLVSRQLKFENKNIEHFFCVEPVSETFECLKKNTSNYTNVDLFNFGLGANDSTMNIFIDESNHGNASLEESMMIFSKYSKYRKEKVQITSVSRFFDKIKNQLKDKKIIIKIDVQGFDELIFSLIPDYILEKTVLLNYEFTNDDNLKKPQISNEKFKKNLNFFQTIWSEEIKGLNFDKIINNCYKNIETDIYLMK